MASSNNRNKSNWTLNPVTSNVKLADYIDQKVQIKGNLTSTPNLIDVSEVISFAETSPSPSPTSLTYPTTPNSSDLPKLYSNLTWEITQTKSLIFTSGKRRIEQEGIYMESEQLTNFPQGFVDYYTNQLTNSGFKETLNSKDPDGITITYSKDELFLTFGVKNITKGSGDTK